MKARLHQNCATARATNGEDFPHGINCECRQLAAALGLQAEAISYFYCRTTLQRRWRMTCRHGEIGAPLQGADSERFKVSDKLTPVLAILIRNS